MKLPWNQKKEEKSEPQKLICAAVSLNSGVSLSEVEIVAEGLYICLVKLSDGSHRSWLKSQAFSSNVGRTPSEALEHLATQQRHSIELFELVRDHASDCEHCRMSLEDLASGAIVAEKQLEMIEAAIAELRKEQRAPGEK